ncbi:MAG TPA: metalloregulator ArsR/SmtB family transcription factor, partial [Candidatus Polarisedimenticolaceae bacterium]|nr:metalloregulator ArsR/SmtB family transcription factor [Candidatus Polarisedimenticolaceae bacterium]
MVEYSLHLDSIFASLSDPTRRDILQRVVKQELSIGEIAGPYDLTFAAVSKHLKVLEKAKLIVKQRRGKQQFVRAAPQALADADEYLRRYRELWENRLD